MLAVENGVLFPYYMSIRRKKFMLIAMDHGNKQCKLVRSEPFISGLTESEVQPFGMDVLKYKDKYYQISDQRIPYRRDTG